jgi:transportin-3
MLAIFCHENSISESEVLMDFWIRMIKTVRVMNDLTIQARFAKTFELLINGCVEKCKVKKELLYEYGVAAKIEDNFE